MHFLDTFKPASCIFLGLGLCAQSTGSRKCVLFRFQQAMENVARDNDDDGKCHKTKTEVTLCTEIQRGIHAA